MSEIALLDANSFFASCERIFRPDLHGKPVVVLSNNDGCVVSRTDEAKELGIGMGVPIYQLQKLLESKKVAIFSANFRLYSDISKRIMELLKTFRDHIEVYSVDECFFDISDIEDNISFCKQIRSAINQGLGIPVSIGIGKTKTLAKIANEVARHDLSFSGVYELDTDDSIQQSLKKLPINAIWGIGYRLTKRFTDMGLKTAFDFFSLPESFLKRSFTSSELTVWRELHGISCHEVVSHSLNKTIAATRSFGKVVEQLSFLEEAVASYTTQAAEKLRAQNAQAQLITVFITTNRFSKKDPFYSNSITVPLEIASADTLVLIKASLKGLHSIFKSGYRYKKAGIILSGISPISTRQFSLFSSAIDEKKSQRLMCALDKLNSRFGSKTVQSAAVGIKQEWRMRSVHRSRDVTSSWKDIILVH